MPSKGNHDTPGPFVYEWVDWHNQLCLDGYLDFPRTLTFPVCREIYGLCLERLTALFPERDCKLTPLDSLVESLIVRFRAQQRLRIGSPSHRSGNLPVEVQVGSVQRGPFCPDPDSQRPGGSRVGSQNRRHSTTTPTCHCSPSTLWSAPACGR